MNLLRQVVLWSCCLFLFSSLSAQINYTANDVINEYDGHFRFGMNQGYYPPWNDKQLGEIAAGNPERGIPGVGVKALRPSLPEFLMEIYGYDFRKSTYEYYEELGMTDHTVILEGPAQWHRDLYNYCGNGNDNDMSRLFANLYSPIWDNGENGTPVNDTNYLALYLYKTVSVYKDHVKFWEIWNEPDFFFYGNVWNYRDPENTWWVRNPDPCEYQLHAPIFHYVRTLRISYEVIKYVDPDAYVSIGALGLPHFLDAVLRNTDNPANGTATEEYPLTGGAYFDVMGYHEYPHIDGSLWTYDFRTDSGPRDFMRNSDRAVNNGIFRKQNEFQAVLDKYGYDGNIYPEKKWIITESNVPRVHYNDPRYYGSEEMQRNYIIKAAIGAMKRGILQFHPYTLGDKKSEANANYEFDLMGMYKNLKGITPYQQEVNDVGIAYKTVSDQLFGSRYDAKRSFDMNLPESVEGGAFVDDFGNYTYALWAKTTIDKSESANAIYSFPASWGLSEMNVYPWNWSYDSTRAFVQNASKIQLTGAPLFFRSNSDSCFCDDIYEPVCGTNGEVYSNACQAACAGISEYVAGICDPTTEGVDLEITSFTADKNPFSIYENVVFQVEVTNNGTEAAEDVVLEFPIPKGVLAYVNAQVSKGAFFVSSRQWQIGNLNPRESVNLDFTLFTLVRQPIRVYAQILSATPEDIDSTPGNGDGERALEDDEAVMIIEYENQMTAKKNMEIENLKIAPNPVQHTLFVNFESNSSELEVEIIDLQGRQLRQESKQLVKGKNTMQIDISTLPVGVYMLTIKDAKSVQTKMFIKE